MLSLAVQLHILRRCVFVALMFQSQRSGKPSSAESNEYDDAADNIYGSQ
jgi:hypothetical protein